MQHWHIFAPTFRWCAQDVLKQKRHGWNYPMWAHCKITSLGSKLSHGCLQDPQRVFAMLRKTLHIHVQVWHGGGCHGEWSIANKEIWNPIVVFGVENWQRSNRTQQKVACTSCMVLCQPAAHGLKTSVTPSSSESPLPELKTGRGIQARRRNMRSHDTIPLITGTFFPKP